MDIKEKDIKAFESHAKALAKLIRRIKKYCPKANYYLANESLHLMKGPSHDDTIYANPLQENIVETVSLYDAGGGDW